MPAKSLIQYVEYVGGLEIVAGAKPTVFVAKFRVLVAGAVVALAAVLDKVAFLVAAASWEAFRLVVLLTGGEDGGDDDTFVTVEPGAPNGMKSDGFINELLGYW